MARRERFHTRLEIIKLASETFLTEGYTNASTKKMAKELNISPGNLAYHFPTKEHLLAELSQHLCEYHRLTLEHEVKEGRTSLLAYCLELASMMAQCEENPVARDLYVSIYTHPMSLSIVRGIDGIRAKEIFGPFCPDWEDEDFALTQNVSSGIEYASLMRENAETLTLDRRVAKTLNVVMRIYNVPEDLRRTKIEKVLAMDYRRIGRRFIEGFADYVEDINQRALQEANKD